MRKNNKKTFIIFFIATNIALIFLQIHKHTLFIKKSYQQQLYEKTIEGLNEKKQKLTQELSSLTDREKIKQFAITKLTMKPYKLSQIKNLTTHET